MEGSGGGQQQRGHQTPNPAKRTKTDSSTDTDNLHTTNIQVSVLESINWKLDILGMLHQKIKDLRSSLEFTHHQIGDLHRDNAELLTSQIVTIQKENKTLKETFLDIQTQSMRYNLIFSGIPENTTPQKLHALCFETDK